MKEEHRTGDFRRVSGDGGRLPATDAQRIVCMSLAAVYI
jgi:hypothetical protein